LTVVSGSYRQSQFTCDRKLGVLQKLSASADSISKYPESMVVLAGNGAGDFIPSMFGAENR